MRYVMIGASLGILVSLVLVLLGACTTIPAGPNAKPEDCMVLGQDNVWRTCQSLGRGF